MYISNYRPITLLNCDYKIISKVVNNRIYVLPKLVIHWIKIVYKEPKCRVIKNNYISHFFDIKNGKKQGDPLSPTIFVLRIEYLAVMLRQSKDYQRFEIEHHCFKVSLFADDTVIYLNGNSFQFKYVFDILDSFGKESGCKVNLSKSYAFYIGSSMGKKFKPFFSIGLSRLTFVIKYLGVNIPLNKFDELSLFEENFASTIHNLQSTLNLWLVRGLTFLGKITVLKTLVIPKLIHKALYLLIHLPEKFFKQLNQVLFTFIWGSKWKKIGRSQLCCSIKEGGAKMIDVKQYLTALKFKWIFKIFNENFVADWKTIVSFKSLSLLKKRFY